MTEMEPGRLVDALEAGLRDDFEFLRVQRRPVSGIEGLEDIWIVVPDPTLPAVILSVSQRHALARVLAEDYVFEPVPVKDVVEITRKILLREFEVTVAATAGGRP